jgi:hypothetical protein
MADEVLDQNAADAKDSVSRVRSAERLDELEAAEKEGKARTSVLEAISARREALGGDASGGSEVAAEGAGEKHDLALDGGENDPRVKAETATSRHGAGDAEVTTTQRDPAQEVTGIGQQHLATAPDGRTVQVNHVWTGS